MLKSRQQILYCIEYSFIKTQLFTHIYIQLTFSSINNVHCISHWQFPALDSDANDDEDKDYVDGDGDGDEG